MSASVLIPRKLLVVPPLVPLVVFGFACAAEAMGHKWSTHGDAGVIYSLFIISIIGATGVECYALPNAVKGLCRDPLARTAMNFACTGFAFLFVVATLALIVLLVGGAAFVR